MACLVSQAGGEISSISEIPAQFSSSTARGTSPGDGLPITTSAYSPQSNGLAEAFFGRFKRDYISGADAESVLVQLGGWFEDYNTHAPHAALAMRSPAEYRAEATLSSSR